MKTVEIAKFPNVVFPSYGQLLCREVLPATNEKFLLAIRKEMDHKRILLIGVMRLQLAQPAIFLNRYII